MAYAHSVNPQGKRHDLVAHLRAVGHLTAAFAEAFDAKMAGYYAGLWHDLGKFDPRWQQYLLSCEANPTGFHGRVDHKGAGTLLAMDRLPPLGLLIQGHHGGLRTPTDLKTWLSQRRLDPGVTEALQRARAEIPGLEPRGPIAIPSHVNQGKATAEFFLRLLFSALIDADRLDTERHFRPEIGDLRGTDVSIAELWDRFERDQEQTTGRRVDAVGKARHEIYRLCLSAAEEPPGIFRLTVPTGGGKTRSAMGFALRHALRYGHRRVVVAVPYISITQQTAEVYRHIFGSGDDERPVVLEHHSGGEVQGDEEEDFSPKRVWSRLSAENWDAPIIVTTTLQLFESLFANGTSPTRKLHRLARSIIILDEAQSLPAHVLDPILDGLRELARNYGATIVISTATQPAFQSIPAFAAMPAKEVVPEPGRFFDVLRRVRYEWRTDEPVEWEEIASEMRGEPSSLAILNTKRDAMDLLDALDDSDAAVLHLSTLLCGAHRSRVIREVRRRLAIREPCSLVSTQVVEAGVDMDFPLVLRAVGPLDSIIQAAGRCNREGTLDRGRVIVFRPIQDRAPKGPYSIGIGITRALLGRGPVDPDDPATSREYFEWLFDTVNTDREGIQGLREKLDYPEVARRFQMIDDDTESVVVTRYGSAEEQSEVLKLIERLKGGSPDARRLMRQLQPYMVAVRRREAARYRQQGFLGEPLVPGVSEWLGSYDSKRGLLAADLDPDALVI